MAHRVYLDCPLYLGEFEIVGAEARHLAGVCRIQPTAPVVLFNGDGREYRGRVTSVLRGSVNVQIQEIATPARETAYRLEIAVPLPKADRGQFLVEKLTEIGVTRYVPLRTERSIVHPGQSRHERLKRHVVEACKQCGRNTLMEIAEVATWTQYLEQSASAEVRLIAHPAGAAGGGQSTTISDNRAVTVAVGPEGGFTDLEIAGAVLAGWKLIDLGPRILRVETAAIVLAAWASGLIPSWARPQAPP